MTELPAPRDTRNSDELLLAVTEILEALGRGTMIYNAERFEEEDGTPHVPTYGLRVAADGFCRAAGILADASRPLSRPRRHVFTASMKNAAIGLYAFSQAMEHDWNMIKPRCGLHCKTCRSRCSAEFLRALEQIVADNASRVAVDSERVTRATRACANAANAFVAYADEVGKTDSFKESWKHWRVVAEQVDALAEPLADVLSAESRPEK